MCTEFGSVPAERHYRYRAMLVPPVRCWCAEVADGLRKSVCVRGARDGRRVSRAERRLLAVGGPLGRPRYSPTNCGLPACAAHAGPLYSALSSAAPALPWTRSMHWRFHGQGGQMRETPIHGVSRLWFLRNEIFRFKTSSFNIRFVLKKANASIWLASQALHQDRAPSSAAAGTPCTRSTSRCWAT
jgi:hypothetical protein